MIVVTAPAKRKASGRAVTIPLRIAFLSAEFQKDGVPWVSSAGHGDEGVANK
jgi:hypothetical protein